ncbi:PITH domain-containing protein [Mycena galopus ATCC 62051]|nr:PITH domain-containing protein [Mycena galopus ATCC 62051]
MIIRIPFTTSVTLRSLLLKTGATDQTPLKVNLYPKEGGLDFQDIDDKAEALTLDIAPGNEVGEYSIKNAAKFSNISSISLFFDGSQLEDAPAIQLYYIGFRGTYTELKQSVPITVYETQANLADHEKIQGTDGGLSSPQV